VSERSVTHKRTDDGVEAVEFDTLDEAIAHALADIDAGGVVCIHDAECEVDENDEGCTCDPMTLVKGAEA
jgi:hypothetical protein